MNNILEVKNLSVYFRDINGKDFPAAKNINFTLKQGEVLGIVGESGSGKSVTALSVLGLLPYPKAHHDKISSIRFLGKELIGLDDKSFQNIRGNEISFIFQEPMSSLNSLHKIGRQIGECLKLHQNLSSKEIKERVIQLLKIVKIPNPEQKANAYPFELSGGQRQRVMIAMAIANNPKILIADEPTTALDVTVQKEIIELLLSLKQKLNMSIIFISHDLRLVHHISDKIAVMYKGDLVEYNSAENVFLHPENDYTKKLIHSSIKLNIKENNEKIKIFEAENITVEFPIKRNFFGKITKSLKAVDNVSFSLNKGETLGIVGESGSGKTTLASAIVGLVKYKGKIISKNKDIHKKNNLKNKDIQIVFQDPYNSLNPRMNVAEIILEGMKVHYKNLSSEEQYQQVLQMLKDVGLSEDVVNKYPNEFSGGQRQRIALARALIIKPEIVILDEPTSALDVTVQAQIMELLKQLQLKYDLSYIFISHDMHAVKSISHKVMVMKNGKIVEKGSAEKIFNSPSKSYTKNLIAASIID